ncbi:MAG: tRNA pseudouridine(38-40) synthase TruA [Vicinamibacterales bacterium]
MPRTLRLTLAYDGTAFAGWQRQANAVSVQEVLEDELAAILGARALIVGAGRTDSGVHAAGQIASVEIDHPIACPDLVRALNAKLPGDIRVRHADDTFAGFDARHDAVTKTYRYGIWNGAAPSPFLRHVVWHVVQPLDVSAMASAASSLVGRHDFAAFRATGGDAKTTTRRLLQSDLREVGLSGDESIGIPALATNPPGFEARLLRYEVRGTGFLRHMVRAIVGTLVDIGRARTRAEDMAAILASCDRARAGMTAPAQGLMLWTVEYGPGPRLPKEKKEERRKKKETEDQDED